MSSYDQIEGFEYWDKEAWKKFVNDHLLPIQTLTETLLELRKEIISKTSERTLSDLEDNNLLKILLGGIDERGEYKEHSLALFIKNAFGIYIDAKQYTALARAGASPLEHVKPEPVVETDFVKLLEGVNSLASNAIAKVGMETAAANQSEELIKEPEKILEVLRELHEKLVQVTANYNYYTFFALSTRSLPFFYLAMAYPRLQGEFSEMTEFLGLEIKFKPETDVQDLAEKYTIWGHAKGGLCDTIYDLNMLIWDINNPDSEYSRLLSVFGFVSSSPMNLKAEYLSKMEKILKINGWDVLKHFPSTYYLYLSIKGLVVRDKCRRPNLAYIEFQDLPAIYKDKSLLEILDDLSPALFLGYIHINYTYYIDNYSGDKILDIDRAT